MREINVGNGIASIYFIGIGGIHMSGLAELMFRDGYIVLGSDQKDTSVTKRLSKMGVPVFIGHNGENIKDEIDLVVYTSAVPPDNAELVSARAKNKLVLERGEFLGRVMRNYKFPVCVAGTHGKTSATSMVSEIFMEARKDPTLLIGGVLPSVGGSMKIGGKDFFIVESCEYCDNFLKFHPFAAIILNIEKDHTDYFGSLANIRLSFRKFAELIPPEGFLVINAAIQDLEEITSGLRCHVITYGKEGGENADWTYSNVAFDEKGCGRFDAKYKGVFFSEIELGTVGEHNIQNALAACAAANVFGIGAEMIANAVNRFGGAIRRFQFKGKVNGFAVYDDYAHHPTEIKATLAAAKNCSYEKMWCIFQPHTKQRTAELFAEFAESFDAADKIILVDIYNPAGREDAEMLVHSSELAEEIKKRGKEVYYIPTFAETVQFVMKNCGQNDLLITMGAGDVYKIGDTIVSENL